MNTSHKIKNIRSENPFERLIYEKGLRAIDMKIYTEQDSMIVVLNNGNAIEVKLSSYPVLKNASENALDKWRLVFGGTGFEWKSMNYDISLKSLLEENAIYSALQKLQGSSLTEIV